MERLSHEEMDKLVEFPVTLPASGKHSIPFSYASHVKYRPKELKCEERSTSARTGEFKKRLLALWWLNDEQPVPYAFRIADGSVRSMDAGCLGMLSLKANPEISFSLDTDGHIVAVSPAPATLAAWVEYKELLLKQVQPAI